MNHGSTIEQKVRSAIGTGLAPNGTQKASLLLKHCNNIRFFTPENYDLTSGNFESQLAHALFEEDESGNNVIRVHVSGIGGGDGGDGDIYVNGFSKNGNNLVLTLSNGGTVNIPNIYNKETLVYYHTVNPNTTPPTQNTGDRAIAQGDLCIVISTKQVYKYNGSAWDLIYDPYAQYEEFTLDGSGMYTLATILGFGTISSNPARYDLFLEGQKQYLNNSDFTVSTNTLNFGSIAAGQRGSLQLR